MMTKLIGFVDNSFCCKVPMFPNLIDRMLLPKVLPPWGGRAYCTRTIYLQTKSLRGIGTVTAMLIDALLLLHLLTTAEGLSFLMLVAKAFLFELEDLFLVEWKGHDGECTTVVSDDGVVGFLEFDVLNDALKGSSSSLLTSGLRHRWGRRSLHRVSHCWTGGGGCHSPFPDCLGLWQALLLVAKDGWRVMMDGLLVATVRLLVARNGLLVEINWLLVANQRMLVALRWIVVHMSWIMVVGTYGLLVGRYRLLVATDWLLVARIGLLVAKNGLMGNHLSLDLWLGLHGVNLCCKRRDSSRLLGSGILHGNQLFSLQGRARSLQIGGSVGRRRLTIMHLGKDVLNGFRVVLRR